MSAVRLLTGVNRTWRGQPNSVENDPDWTSADAVGFMSFHARSRAVTCAAPFVL